MSHNYATIPALVRRCTEDHIKATKKQILNLEN